MLSMPDEVLCTMDEMSVLSPEVRPEFQEGIFVEKRTDLCSNQKSGGVVSITRIVSSLSRWTLAYNLRTESRMEKDGSDEGSIIISLEQQDVFQDCGDSRISA